MPSTSFENANLISGQSRISSTKIFLYIGVKAISQFTQVNKERLAKLAEWVD